MPGSAQREVRTAPIRLIESTASHSSSGISSSGPIGRYAALLTSTVTGPDSSTMRANASSTAAVEARSIWRPCTVWPAALSSSISACARSPPRLKPA